MKTKNFKRVLTLVLALAMLFSLSMVAFAYDGQVEIIVRTSSYDLTNHVYSYTQIADLTNVGINVNDSVKDAINREFVTNWSGSYLHKLTVGNNDYETTRHALLPGTFDEDGFYLGGDPVIDSLNQLTEFSAHDDIYMSALIVTEQESYDGYFFMGDMQYMCSISYDWIYEVSTDNGATFYRPLNNQGLLATMDEHEPVDGEIIRLTYGLVWEIFDPATSPYNN